MPARAHWEVVPSLTVWGSWDDNVYGEPAPTADEFSQIAPAVSAGWWTPRLEAQLAAGMAGEVWRKQQVLDSPVARDNVTASAQLRATEVTNLSATGSWFDTTDPSELPTTNGILPARLRTQMATGSAAAAWRMSPVFQSQLTFFASHVAQLDQFTDARILTADFSQAQSLEDAATLELATRQLQSDSTVSDAVVVEPGWTHNFDSTAGFSLRAGPSLRSGGGWDVEGGGTLFAESSPVTRWTLAAARTQTTAPGIAEILDTNSLTGMVVHTGDPVDLHAALGLYESVSAGVAADALSAEFGVVRHLRPGLALDFLFRTGLQRIDQSEYVHRDIVSVGFTVTPP